ncbi:SusC/RagA family TonB-linked outer membrane protein [Sphingobacterium suaedae]|uniref:SusC/RagA family TonB-linked outer membrane protein n=1 Tax=Sphingobacterium suaedae TaxID=1686402 RepID=A0ABW5KJ63_9SPHI
MNKNTQGHSSTMSLRRALTIASALVAAQLQAMDTNVFPMPSTEIRAGQTEIEVVGQVSDGQNPIPGLTVLLKGKSQIAVSTDATGNFSIKVPANGILVFQMIGYQTKEVPVNNQTSMQVTMSAQNTGLEEVVVVAYGTQKKANLTGAVATISNKQLVGRPVSSTQNALQGLTPGVTVLQRPGDVNRKSADGTAGNTGGVTIRGRSNLGSSSPMYIIDGIPANAQEFASINPNDIENMSVLKDAASAALYGSRAANGVIVVTTKRGGGDRAVISLNATYGLQSATRLPHFTNSADYATLYNEAMRNAGRAELFTPEQIQKFTDGSDPDLYPNTDWYKTVLRKNAPQSDVNLNIAAPGKITDYYLGLSYLQQESLIPDKDQQRIVAKLNTTSKVLPDLLKVGTNFSFIKQDYNRSGADMSWTELNRSLPTAVVRQSDGNWGSINAGAANADVAKRNQLRRIEEGGSSWDRDNYLQTAINASLTPLEGLSINGLASLKYTYSNSWNFDALINPIPNFLTGELMPSTAYTPNEMKEYWRKRQELLLQSTVDYERTFGAHFAKATVGVSQESNIFRQAFVGRKNFPNNDMTTVGSGSTNPSDISSDDDGQANRSLQEEWAIRSFFGRVNYSFDDRYLLEANIRMDYSSRFRSDLRRAVFPSFSGAWRISNEQFMENVSWIDNLKLRASWGSLGNQDVVKIGNYFELINTGYAYSFEGTPNDGAWQNQGVNALALWEKVYMSNVGVDFSVWKGKLDITADYFIKTTDGILMQSPKLRTYGIPDNGIPYENAAKTKNKGLEIAVTHNGTIGSEFRYSINANVSAIKNTILSLGDVNERTNSYFIERVGESVGSIYGYVADGLFVDQADINAHATQAASTKPGDIKYRDINGDGLINADDRTIIGNDVPWVNYGFNASAAYKGIDFSVITYGVPDVQTYLENEASFPFFNGAGIKEELKNRWTPENPDANADFPRLLASANGTHNYNNRSSFWVFSGSYFRIRAITLGYTFDKDVSKKWGMSNVRIFAAANNPFTIMADKRLSDYDPEIASGRGGYPGIKTWSVGLNASF